MKVITIIMLAVILSINANASSCSNYDITIKIKISGKNYSDGDKFVLRIRPVLGAYAHMNFTVDDVRRKDIGMGEVHDYNTLIKNQSGKFQIKINQIFCLANIYLLHPNGNLENVVYGDPSFYLYKGNNLLINVNKGGVQFSGNGAQSMEMANRLRNLEISHNGFDLDTNNVITSFKKLDSFTNDKLHLIESYKSWLSKAIYDYLKTETIIDCERGKYDFLFYHISICCSSERRQQYFSILHSYKDPIWNDSIEKGLRTSYTAIHNLEYLDFLVGLQLLYNQCFLKGNSYDMRIGYHYLTRNYSGPTREWLIFRLIHNNMNNPIFDYGNELKYCINDALKSKYIENISIRNYLKFVLTTNIPGQTAYNFAMADTNGKIVHLSDFRGKVVLLDFYFQYCGSCEQIHPYLDTIKDKLAGKDFVLIAIMLDNIHPLSREEWMKTIKSNVYASMGNINLIAKRLKGKGYTEFDITNHMGSNIGGSTLVYIDKEGKYLPTPLSPRTDGGKAALKLIQENL